MSKAPPLRLGVNVDHVATLRQARKSRYPDPITAAAIAELAGAEQITIHLREDRRHIQVRDLKVLRDKTKMKLSFGAATWPHQMVRVMLLEQLYRAATILTGHPYHRV